MMSLVQQLEAIARARTVLPLLESGTDLSDQAQRQIDRGEKFCSAHSCYHAISEFGTRTQGGKKYFLSSCKAVTEAAKKESERKRRKPKGKPVSPLAKLLRDAQKRADILAAGGALAMPSKTIRGWHADHIVRMLAVLPDEFDRVVAAKIWGFATKMALVPYFDAMRLRGLVTVEKKGSKYLDVFRKTGVEK